MRIVAPMPQEGGPRQNQQKNNFFFSGDFRPLPNKNVQMLDHFFPFRISKNIGHPTSGSGGKKTVKWYLKSEQKDKQKDKHTDGHFDLQKASAQRADALKMEQENGW